MNQRFIEVPPWVTAGVTPAATASLTRSDSLVSVPLVEIDAPAVEQPVWTFHFSTGDVLALTGLGIVGRDPASGEHAPLDHRVAVGAGEKSVSKTHLAFGLDGVPWVQDRNSTNGTFVTSPGSARRACPSGSKVPLANGDVVGFGDLYFTVSCA